MILQALNTYYHHLLARVESGISLPGYTKEKISYVLIISRDGSPLDVQANLEHVGKKSFAKLLSVPASFKRSGITPKAFFLWDKTSYVFGVERAGKDSVLFSPKAHAAFCELHEELLLDTKDEEFLAFLKFLGNWKPEDFKPPMFKPEMLDANFVFRIDGRNSYLHDSAAAKNLRQQNQAEIETSTGMCLVSGEMRPVARLHPAIKDLSPEQTMGGSIVSFNLDSFSSYGKSQGENAPVSEQAAFAYTTALNHLLRRSEHNRQRIQIGDASVVFWAEADDADQAQEAELTFEALLNAPLDDFQEGARVRDVLQQIAKGRPLNELNPKLQEGTRMFVLGLAPNASRISIRFWETGTLGSFAQRLAQHERDFRIDPLPWKTAPSVDRVTLETAPARWNAQKKRYEADKKSISPHLAGEILRAVLTGRLYPRSLLSNTLMRIRSDGNVSGLRAAICKGILAREQRLGFNTPIHKEEVPVSLDKQSENPGYRLGRLFAVLEAVQRNALGSQVNATIRDRYYGAASSTPASVFPVLLRNTQNHLGKLRKDKPGLASFFEKEIGEIVGGLSDCFPRYLPLQGQGCFTIGYYHQSHSRPVKGEPNIDTDQSDTEGPNA